MRKTFAILFIAVSWCAPCHAAGVKGTPHDLSASSPTTGPKATTETQLCVFCHTPHGASQERDLWNHQLSAVTQYTMPASPTQLSTPTNPPDGSSKLCLSCHDGTVAIGAVLRDAEQSNVTISLTGTGPGGVMPGSPVPGQHASDNLGTDLSGTHLVAIAVNDQLISDKNAQYANNLTSMQLAYPPPGDPVKLSSTGNLYKGQPGKNSLGVQCTSCHDPHDNTNGKFLVKPVTDNGQTDLSLQGGTLCETCHPTL
ncbi:MAG TPA: cytochrome c3 family protein [Geobacteraceae bacterium]